MDLSEESVADMPTGVKEMLRNKEMTWPVESVGDGVGKAMSFEECVAEQRSKSWYLVLPKEAVERLNLEAQHQVLRYESHKQSKQRALLVTKIRICRGLHVAESDVKIKQSHCDAESTLEDRGCIEVK